jgi:hypothetical protein
MIRWERGCIHPRRFCAASRRARIDESALPGSATIRAMRTSFRLTLTLASVAIFCLLCLTSASAPADYGDTYTPEQLSALDQALHAINCTRQDLLFEKDYGKGYACFPVVREMLHDPLAIAPFVIDLGGRGNPANAGTIGSPESNLHDPFGVMRSLLAATRSGDQKVFLGWREAHPNGKEFSELAESKGVFAAATAIAAGSVFWQVPENRGLLREALPQAMAWHFVDKAGGKTDQDEKDPTWIYKSLSEMEQIGVFNESMWRAPDPRVFEADHLAQYFPKDQPVVAETQYGRICVGTLQNDTYSGDFAVLIDPGGNDTYRNCRIGAAYGKPTSNLGKGEIGYFADLGGDDFYDCADVDITLGAAVLGCAAFYDLGAGNDRYYAGSCSLGAAMGGIALFYDDGGSDTYSGKVYTQGAAGFGIGLMIDDSVQPAPVVATDVETPDPIDIRSFDNDTYTAWSEAQAFARTRGVALCINRRGNEVYHAGGVYLDAPLFTDRYASFSQGFAIGERDIDYAGGIALLADYGGNDRYLGDIYNQGVGYWYSAGLLYDGGGNDTYEMTQYGQGSGIHLAVGGLVDESGHDTYVMHSGLGQGSSHDFATSILLDRAGNDKYYGTTTNCGTALTNSACLFIDGGGDDTYAARVEGGLNYGRPARDAGSIGLFVDMAGKDDYLGAFADSSSWTNTQYGSGVDAAPPPPTDGDKSVAATGLSPGGLAVPTDKTVIPEIVSYTGPLTKEVFDQLWEIAIRWEVGDNQLIVPKARQRLIAFGPDVLPYVEAKMDDPNSLAVRGYVDVLKAFAFIPPPPVAQASAPADSSQKAAGIQSPAPPQPAQTLPLVEALLARQLATGDSQRQMSALSVAGELVLPGVGDAVAKLLDDPDAGMQRRALGTLGLLGSHTADARVIALLDPATSEPLLKAAIATAIKLKLDCYPQLRTLLDVPKFTARDALRGLLAANMETYGTQVLADFDQPSDLSVTAQRTILGVFRAYDKVPKPKSFGMLDKYFSHPDWGVRSDAAALVDHWHELMQKLPGEEIDIDWAGIMSRGTNGHEGEPWPNRN